MCLHRGGRPERVGGSTHPSRKAGHPADDANPYYSTGSAYLDKVFQYQLSLPPLLTQSVSKYAATLVENRTGLWAEIKREYVLSVLIPTHVTSPRRVKHLLNTFALTYRLAQERHKSDLLAEDPRTNAAAIARLVCLRVEFPLFARHLEVDANLPASCFNCCGTEMRNCPPEPQTAPLKSPGPTRLRVLPRAPFLSTTNPTAMRADDRATQIGKAHNKQLLNYLSRTRQVRGPSRDVIYMQSTGTVFGLDGELALAVERAAEDADIGTPFNAASMGSTKLRREGVLLVLTNQIRTGAGLAGPNAARSFLLLTAADPSLPVAKVADTVAEAICVLDDDTTDFLDEDTAASAWALTKVGSEASAPALRRRVIAADYAPWLHGTRLLLP